MQHGWHRGHYVKPDRKTNNIWSHLYMESKKKKKKIIGREQWLPGVECRLNGEILVNGL